MDTEFEIMDIKWIRDGSIGLGAFAMVAISPLQAIDIAAGDDPATDLALVTVVASSATGPQFPVRDEILGEEFVVDQSRSTPRIEFHPTDQSSGSIVSSS